MNGFLILDAFFRGGSIALLLLWSWLLFRDHWDQLSAKVAMALNVGVICHVLASTPMLSTQSFEVGGTIPSILLDIGSVSTVGLFWLFARVWFDDIKSVGWRELTLVALPPGIVALIYVTGNQDSPFNFGVWFPILRIIWFAFIAHGLWIAWRGRADDLVETRRRLRLQIVVAIGLLALLVNLVEIAVFRFGWSRDWRTLPEMGITLITLIMSGAMFAHRHADHFGTPRRASAEEPHVSLDDPLAHRLIAHMEREMPHRDEGLTIAGLAAQLGMQEYQLRRLINGAMGHRNFATFLNGYRLAEVKAALADPTQKDVPILTIALDAGFGSLGPFNRAFRDAEGMTPSEFRAGALANA